MQMHYLSELLAYNFVSMDSSTNVAMQKSYVLNNRKSEHDFKS